MITPKLVLTTVAAVMTLATASWAWAADCPYRGTLDSQYCDRNRDLVADLPLDESQWVDPDTIIFSYTPVEDPSGFTKIKVRSINFLQV